ncbi:NUDIX domain-containing protein [Candidatus Nomurabacteria bacterium]|nr:NUDIX domain-containing protein [Candidatus Nomurabacteria bacterium]
MEIKEDKSFGVIPVFKDSSNNFNFCLIQHEQGHWGFPKGHQDAGESEKETAVRELKEETGVSVVNFVNDKSFIVEYPFKKNDIQYNKSVKYFLGFVSSMITETPESFKKEIPELKWVNYEEAKKLITFSEEKKVLDKAFKYLAN